METWNKSRIDQMILDKVEENLNLDYKAANALDRGESKKKEIVKDVSSFANSAGGVIIYGVSENQDSDKRHFAERIDPVQREQFSKEALDQVIQTIQPRINGVRIHVVSISETQCCYVVDIPKSETAHMARDGRYYKRHEFTAIAMEEYEVRDVYNRRTHPKIEASFHIFRDSFRGRIIFKIKNTSKVIAKNGVIILEVPSTLVSPITIDGVDTIVHDDDNRHYWYLELPFENLYPGLEKTLFRNFDYVERISINGPRGANVESREFLKIQIFADEMPFISKEVPVLNLTSSWINI
ncbi:hypothetical protein DB346_24375 [Verrucomicrobia bacterium LW23]|nr:hypothetical protein DB346_24375 [Verrucomicrobia bacterium LW23]